MVEFDQIKTEYGRNSFAMSPSQLKDNKNIKELELLQKQVNEEKELLIDKNRRVLTDIIK